MSNREAALRRRFESAGQDHVFAFWSDLNAAQREQFLVELGDVDLELVARLASLARERDASSTQQRFTPPDVFPLERDAEHAEHAQRARARGVELLRDGRVAWLLVAGGQASRLGYDGPKGAFPVGPVTGRSLFELFSRRLLAARERTGAPPRWYVMTSQQNDARTRTFFAEHGWFGLQPDEVFFFRQAMLPTLDEHGRIL